MELNPEHAVTKKTRDQWHKICAIVMFITGVKEVIIKEEHVLALGADTCVVAHDLPDGLHIKIMTTEEAMKLAQLDGPAFSA
jgi:hypothetical protein